MGGLDDATWNEITFTSQNGLKLFARHYPAAASNTSTTPLLCLPGLTRNSKDFHLLASHLAAASETPRDVYCVDYRGRGQSAYDEKWENYLSLIHISEPTRRTPISYAVFCLKKKNKKQQ